MASATLSQLVATIAKDITRTGFDADIQECILAAIIDVEVNRLWFNETSGYTINTVIGQADYDLTIPANQNSMIVDFFEVDWIRTTINGSVRGLSRSPSSAMDDIDIADNTLGGEPSSWGFYGGKFRLYPIPQLVFPVSFAGHFKVAPLTSGDQTNVWLEKGKGYELVRRQATARILTSPFRDFAAASTFSQIAGTELETLKNQKIIRKRTDTIRPLRGGF